MQQQQMQQGGERHRNDTSLETGPTPVKNASGLTSRVSAGELWMIVVPGIGFLFEVNDNFNTLMNLIEFLPLIGGFVYDEEYLEGGVYYHHTGSSWSEPRGSNSWISALKKAFGMQKDDTLYCCTNGCEEEACLGAHLTESRIMEFLSLVGLGGTPVVPMCYSCHGTGPIEIDGTACIYDKGTPIDILWGKPSLSSVTCVRCERYTQGPDEDEGYWCLECEHVVDSEGDCITEGCSTCEDDDDDDDGWW
ncbi:MAG: hypothetical protein CMA17_04095 [Euryarchaeota archaeon]|nr:hypothetical protein [Euryarchaeota archaeon]|tara:strand:+ start:236 stop:982 length:747 start_codon:yes stop_codon:yes gene_type:complete